MADTLILSIAFRMISAGTPTTTEVYDTSFFTRTHALFIELLLMLLYATMDVCEDWGRVNAKRDEELP